MKTIEEIKSWKPGSDRYIVLPEEADRETSTGLLRTKTQMGDDNKQIGVIIAKGQGRTSEYGGVKIPMEFNVGDRVMFGRHAGDTIFVDEDMKIYPGIGDKRDEWVTVKILRQEAILCSL